MINSRHVPTESRKDLSFRRDYFGFGRVLLANVRSHLPFGDDYSAFGRDHLLSGHHFAAGGDFLLPFRRHFGAVWSQSARQRHIAEGCADKLFRVRIRPKRRGGQAGGVEEIRLRGFRPRKTQYGKNFH